MKPALLYKFEDAKEEDGPLFFYQIKNSDKTYQLWSDIVPFSDRQFDAMTRAIIQISETIRDLIYFFVMQSYPDHLGNLQQGHEELYAFRNEIPTLLK